VKTNLIKRLVTIAAAVTIFLAIGTGGAHAGLKDNNNGTITDTSTGLVWLQNADCFGLQNWNQAMDSVANLKSGSCNLTDGSKARQWRLPTKDELVIRQRNTSGFNNVQSSWYWSSTPSAAAHSIIARFLFICWSDKTSVAMETYHNYVWPVRGGQ